MEGKDERGRRGVTQGDHRSSPSERYRCCAGGSDAAVGFDRCGNPLRDATVVGRKRRGGGKRALSCPRHRQALTIHHNAFACASQRPVLELIQRRTCTHSMADGVLLRLDHDPKLAEHNLTKLEE